MLINVVGATAALVLVGVGLLVMYLLGHRQGINYLTDKLRNDDEFSLQALEYLARKHHAKVEVMEPLGTVTEEPTNPERRR